MWHTQSTSGGAAHGINSHKYFKSFQKNLFSTGLHVDESRAEFIVVQLTQRLQVVQGLQVDRKVKRVSLRRVVIRPRRRRRRQIVLK